MPPEPLPWDRREIVFKDRKHERAAGYEPIGLGGGGGGSSSSSSAAQRWRDPYHGPRDFPRASPRRHPPGHYRQGGGYHQIYPEEYRPGDRFWVEDESFRPSSGRYNSGRSGGSREGRGYFRRSPYWDSGDFARQHHEPTPVTAPRSVAVPITPPSDLLSSKETHDKNVGALDDGSGTGQRGEQDNTLGSISWKPLKWTTTRTNSLSSLKTARSEADEVRVEPLAPPEKEVSVLSPMTSPREAEEDVPKKKPRLGWGQGLAKYERQKVGGSEDAAGKNGLVPCTYSAKSTPSDLSPKGLALAGCSSPATPCSIPSSSLPGTEDNAYTNPGTIGNDTTQDIHTSGLDFHNCSEEFSFKFEHFEVNKNSTLSMLLADLLQPEDTCSGDSSFTRHTAMSKLLLFKDDISKELEKTECEIDLYENELKSLDFNDKDDHCQNSILTVEVDSASEPCGEPADGASVVSADSTSLKDQVLASSVAPVREHGYDSEDKAVNNGNSAVSCHFGNTTSLEKNMADSDVEKFAQFPPADENDKVAGAAVSLTTGGGEGLIALSGPHNANYLDASGSNPYVCSDINSEDRAQYDLAESILESNRIAAKKASLVFGKALSNISPVLKIGQSDNFSLSKMNDVRFLEIFSKRKRLLKFKQQALALKYRALQHLWKEDMRLLSMKKHRPKSQKRLELVSRSSLSQKHRSSVRSRFTSPAGTLTLVPTSEMVEFTSKLLADSQMKAFRRTLKMPAFIFQEERRYSLFVANRVIDDPISFEKERSMINPWTEEEKQVFMEKLAKLGKDFTKIASYLDHKTTADCIEFYYKNHKSESFKEVKKRLDLRKQWRCLPANTYLLTSGKKWQRENNAASLDLLGEASMVAAHSNDNLKQTHRERSGFGNFNNFRVSRGSQNSQERASSIESSRHERETAAADVLAGICGALSSEAMSSCVTTSIDPAERTSYLVADRPWTPGVTQSIDEEETCSDEGCGELDSADWTDEEKSVFIRALSMCGKDFAKISSFVGTRSRDQCKIFFSKARKCLGLDLICQGPGNMATPRSDTNGGRSDTDDACAVEMDSAICSTQSCSKMDTDFTQSVANNDSEDVALAGNISLHTERDRPSDHCEAGRPDQEEVEAKIDGHISVSNDNKVVGDVGKSQSPESLKEISDVALRSNESAHGDVADSEAKDGSVLPAPVMPKAVRSSSEAQCSDSHTAGKVEQEFTGGGYCADKVKTEVELQEHCVICESGLQNRKQKIDKEPSSTLCFGSHSKTSENLNHLGNKVNVSPSIIFSRNYQHQMPHELLPYLQKGHQVISLKQENSLAVSLLPDTSSISFGGPVHAGALSNHVFEEFGKKQHVNSVTRRIYQPYSLNQFSQPPFQVLEGYQAQAFDQEEKDARIVGARPDPESCHDQTAFSQLSLFDLDLHNEKTSGPRISHSRSEVLCPSRSEEQFDVQMRPRSQSACLETEVQSHHTGDVKLFGKILSYPSSQQKSKATIDGSDGKPASPSQNVSSMAKPLNSQKDANAYISRPQSSGHIGLESLPLRSYGFWDGNRIQTGFSSLPEPAIMVAKYQGTVTGVSVYSAKNNAGSNGVPSEYQQAYSQPLSSDGKNGYEMLSGLQHQGRAGRVGMNALGGGGILLSGGSVSCTGLSDPVTAIRMQCAAPKILTSELEAWRRGDRGDR